MMKALSLCVAAFSVLAGCQFLQPEVGAAATAPQNAELTNVGTRPGGIGTNEKLTPKPGDQLAAFSGGCFWGTERYYRHVKGVVATAVGYTGGNVSHPSYEQVSSHQTGHAETVLVEFNPKIVTYKQLLQDFWDAHDPTTLNRQGPDEGTNYRSVIWTFNPEQAAQAKESMAEDQKKETSPIVTELHPLGIFWLAEDYHQQYDEKTGTNTCPAPRHGG